MNQVMYCVIHESWTLGDEWLLDECFLTSCPPPALEPNWINSVSIPSDEELEQMDENAALLLADLNEE